MDINEEIAKEYFTSVKQCFIRENVIYKVETQRDGKKKGSGWSDIDLLAYSPVDNVILDIEVKYRERAPFHRGVDKASNLDKVINNFTLPGRIKRISELNDQKLPVKKIFVTNKKALTNKTRIEYEHLLENAQIKLIYFEEIFTALKEYYKKNHNKMTSVIGQMLRVMNNHIKDS